VQRRLKGPRHQFGDAADRDAGSEPGEDVGEISLRVDTVYFAVCRIEYIAAARWPPE
jgi:hypothetical protein